MVNNSAPGIKKLWLERKERIKARGGTTFGPGNVWDLFPAAYLVAPSIVLACNNSPRSEDSVPRPITGAFVDLNSKVGLDYGRSLAFTNNYVRGGGEAKGGPASTQLAAIQNYTDEDKFWKKSPSH